MDTKSRLSKNLYRIPRFPPNLLANLYHQFTNRLSACQVRLRLLHAFRAERVLLVDVLPQRPTLYKAPKLVRVIKCLARSICVVPHAKTDRKREPSKSQVYTYVGLKSFKFF